MTFWRVSRDKGIAVLGRLLDRARLVAVLAALLVLLAPNLATSGVPTSAPQSHCHEVGIDVPLVAVVNGDASPCGDPADTACSAAACAMSTCMAVPLPAMFAVLGHNDIILAVSFGGDQPAAGIDAMPDLRPPIRAVAA